MSDHGLDLEAIAAKAGGHSIFSPSYSPTWLTCSGSLLPSIFADDTAGEDAAYGTVAHEVGEIWLNRVKQGMASFKRPMRQMVDDCEPRELIDTTVNIVQRKAKGDLAEISYDIVRDEDMFAYVREYVEWCAALPGEHYIEQRVDFSRLTPIPNQGGTTDHTAVVPGVLTVSDLKMGKGVRVQAAYVDLMDPQAIFQQPDGSWTFNGNPQAMLYALGTFYEWDWLYHFKIIVIRICQPRLGIFETWETTREELLQFASFVQARAAAAWVVDAPRTPSEKGCQWCKVRGDCPAIMAWTLALHGDKMDDVKVEPRLWYHPESDCLFTDWQQPDDPLCEDVTGIPWAEERAEAQRVRGGVIEGSYTVQQMTAAAEQFVSDGRNDFEPRVPAAKLDTEALEKLLRWRKTVERYFSDVELELTNRALAGVPLNTFKLTTSRTNRKFADHADTVKYARRKLNLEVDDLYKETLLTPAQMEELIHRKLKVTKPKAKQMIEELVIQPRGRDTLAPIADPRKALQPPTDVFDGVVAEDDSL